MVVGGGKIEMSENSREKYRKEDTKRHTHSLQLPLGKPKLFHKTFQ